MPIILGIHSHNVTGAAIIRDGEIASAVNEERFDRVKGSKSFQKHSIHETLREAGISFSDIDFVTIGDYKFWTPHIFEYFKRLPFLPLEAYPIILGRIKHIWKSKLDCTRENKAFLKKHLPGKKPEYIEHHQGHAASAHFTSGNDKNVIVTIDGWGDGLSSGTYLGNRERIERVYHSYDLDSLGYFYGRITVALGFRPHRHEGKITGLAAYGNQI